MTAIEDEQEILISFQDSTLRESDLETIQDEEWLNDAVIALIFEVISAQNPDVTLLPPSVCELACAVDDPQEMLPKLQSQVVLPVNDRYGNPRGSGSHWSCIISRNGKATHYDSMSPANQESARLVHEKFNLPGKLQEGEITPQENASDCGIYVLAASWNTFAASQPAANLAEILTPQYVQKFRKALRNWLRKWSSIDRQLESWQDIHTTIGSLVI